MLDPIIFNHEGTPIDTNGEEINAEGRRDAERDEFSVRHDGYPGLRSGTRFSLGDNLTGFQPWVVGGHEDGFI